MANIPPMPTKAPPRMPSVFSILRLFIFIAMNIIIAVKLQNQIEESKKIMNFWRIGRLGKVLSIKIRQIYYNLKQIFI